MAAEELDNQETQTLSQRLAPEDIRSGDFVVPLHLIREHIPPPWCLDDWNGQVVRVVQMPGGNCAPMEVTEVCLPYLLVRTPLGRHRLLDVRRYRLARVSPAFGRAVFAGAQADRQEEKREAAEEAKAAKPAEEG